MTAAARQMGEFRTAGRPRRRLTLSGTHLEQREDCGRAMFIYILEYRVPFQLAGGLIQSRCYRAVRWSLLGRARALEHPLLVFSKSSMEQASSYLRAIISYDRVGYTFTR